MTDFQFPQTRREMRAYVVHLVGKMELAAKEDSCEAQRWLFRCSDVFEDDFLFENPGEAAKRFAKRWDEEVW